MDLRRILPAIAFLVTLVLVRGPIAAQPVAPERPPTRAELEATSRDLDHQIIDLQHDLMAARMAGDAAAVARIEQQIQAVQHGRVGVLRDLGQFP